MGNSGFGKNGVDKSGTNRLQYVAFIVTAFPTYFCWAFFNDVNFHHFAVKIYKLFNCYGHNPLSFCLMSWEEAFYP